MFDILTLTLDSQILFRQIGYIAPLALTHETLDCVCYLWETVAAKMLYFLPILQNYSFTEYYSTIYNDSILKRAEDVQIISDSNIDLLQYQNHSHTRTYIDTLFTHGLLPLITLPTRITSNSATCIDHISTANRADTYDSGIIISALSDHLPVFYIKHSQAVRVSTREFKSRKINSKTIPIFETLLKNSNWNNVNLEHRPKEAFECFFETIGRCVESAFPEINVQTNNGYFCGACTLRMT